jgi:hypothetical protein
MQEADDENKRKTISIVTTNLLNNSILKALHNGMNDLHIKLHQISTLRSNDFKLRLKLFFSEDEK